MIDFWPQNLRSQALKAWIVDVGAMPAPETYHPLLGQELVQVIAYEPNPAGCEVLNQISPELQAFAKVIGNGQAGQFHFNRLPYASSLLPTDPQILKYLGRSAGFETLQIYPVQTQRLDDCPEIVDCDLLKIDVQGAELDVLEGAKRVLEQTMAVQIEVCFIPFYQNQPLFADLDLYLRSQGFILHTFLKQNFFTAALQPLSQIRSGQQLLWTDALYFRHPDTLGQYSVAKLFKLALLLENCFQATDAAALTLSLCDQAHQTQWLPDFLAAAQINLPPPLS